MREHDGCRTVACTIDVNIGSVGLERDLVASVEEPSEADEISAGVRKV